MSAPRFSNGKTCWMPGSALSASVRWAQASITVRVRRQPSSAKDPVCCGVKATTSQRPTAGAVVPQPGAGGTSCVAGPREGKRFSKTATS